MQRLRTLPAALVGLVGLAVLGSVVTEVYMRNLRGRGGVLGEWLHQFVAGPANPFTGRLWGGPAKLVLAWLLGLVVAGVILWLATVLVARRTDDATATFLGTWLGTVLGVGVGSLVSLAVAFGGSGLGSRLLVVQYHQALVHGLYWGVVAGVLIAALAASLVPSGRSSDGSAEPWDASLPPVRETPSGD